MLRLLSLALTLIYSATPVISAELKLTAADRFVKITSTNGAFTCRSAVNTYSPRSGKGAQILLAANAHGGTRSYFEGINKSLIDCDAVLYEMPDAPYFTRRQDSAPAQRTRRTKSAVAFLTLLLNAHTVENGHAPEKLTQLIEFTSNKSRPIQYFLPHALLDGWGRPFIYKKNESGFTLFSEKGVQVSPSKDPVGRVDHLFQKDGSLANVSSKPTAPEKHIAQGIVFSYESPNFYQSDLCYGDPMPDPSQISKAFNAAQIPPSSAFQELIKTKPAASIILGLQNNNGQLSPYTFGIQMSESFSKVFQTFVTSRNKIILADIKTLQATPNMKRIAVLYGAGHMPHVEAEVLLTHKLTKTEWHTIDSINLEKANITKSDLEVIETHIRAKGKSLQGDVHFNSPSPSVN